MSNTHDLLIEIGCEELPAGTIEPLLNQLEQYLLACLQQHHVAHAGCTTYATPRRLALLLKNVAAATPEQQQLKKGPFLAQALDHNQQPKPAALGFAKACGVSFDQLTTCHEDKGERLCYTVVQPGQQLKTALAGWLNTEVLNKIHGLKMMRWGSKTPMSFPRPVHWVLGKLGSETLEGEVLGCTIGSLTYGHRFHQPQALHIAEPHAYVEALMAAKVMVDIEQRQQTIVAQIKALTPKDHHVELDAALLKEVVHLVEWPQALLGEFDHTFLQLPQQALQAVLHHHQRCFLVTHQTQLAPYFVTVSNIESQNPEQVIRGNRKVMRARLSDAMFFYEQDQQLTLAAHGQKLTEMVYQRQLGTLSDKVQRLQRSATTMAAKLGLDASQLEQACQLCKADLSTALVYEFPELHGAVAQDLALKEGHHTDVATALIDHLKPHGGHDELPQQLLSQALAILDRLDHLVGFFAINKMPTGDKDPFALRRSAIALLRLLLALPKSLSVDELLVMVIDSYPKTLISDPKQLTQQLKLFVFERFTAWCQTHNIPLGFKQGLPSPEQHLFYPQHMAERLRALLAFYQQPEVNAFIAAYKRVHNMTKAHHALSPAAALHIDAALLTEPSEQNLNQARTQAAQFFAEQQTTTLDFSQALAALTQMVPAINVFFDEVMVMVDDPAVQQNRIQLLLDVRRLFLMVADFSVIPYEHLVSDNQPASM